MDKVKCECCGEMFLPKRKKYCSRSCAATMRNKKRWENEEYRKKYFETVHSDEYRQKCAIASKELWKRDGHKERVRESWQNTFNSSEYTRNLISENSKRMWADEEKKNEISKKIKEKLNTPEMKEWRSLLMIEKWKDDGYADNWLKHCFTYRDITLPSGNVVKLQGYEPQVLTQLLNEYSEDDICIGRKDIEKNIGKILYDYKGSAHRYFPDFYIKSIDTIIEVKSEYTFNLHKEKNLAKEQACLKKGHNFIFKIITK